MWERPPPRSHRTGLYHQLFSLMGQGRMLLSICLSMAFSLISCPWPPLGSPHHTHLLHLWSLHLSTSFSLFSWLCVYLERNLWHVTILFSCNAICFGRNGGEWRGDDLTTTTTTTYRSSFVFQQMCIGHRLGHGEREVFKVLSQTKCQVISPVVGFLRPLLYAIIGGQWRFCKEMV